jgi:hypothetical protein
MHSNLFYITHVSKFGIVFIIIILYVYKTLR